MITKIHKTIISTVVVAILFGLYIYFDLQSRKQASSILNIATTTDTTSDLLINKDTSPSYTIEKISIDNSTTKTIRESIPDLNRPVIISDKANISTETLLKATEAVVSLQAKLKSDPKDFHNWLELASYQKLGGDYEGAIISWLYASKIAPKDYVALANIADTYGYYLKDNTKTEMYYKQAIARSPAQSLLYIQFAEFYNDVVKDKAKALDIVEQGLSAIPNEPSLLGMKDSLN